MIIFFIPVLLFSCSVVNKINKPEKHITITYDALKDTIIYNNSNLISSDGNINIKITNINLFLYSIYLTEQQNNFINNEKISEATPNININPVNFNISDIFLNIPLIFVNMNKPSVKKANQILLSIDSLKNIAASLDDSLTLIKDSMLLKFCSLKSDTLQTKANDTLKIKLNYRKSKMKIDNNLYSLKQQISYKKNEYNETLNNMKDTEVLLNDCNIKINLYFEAISRLNELIVLHERYITLLYSSLSIQNIKNEKDKILKDFFKIDEIGRDVLLKHCYERLNNIDKAYIELSISFNRLPDDNINKKTYEKIVTFQQQIKKIAYYNFFKQIANIYDAISEENFQIAFTSTKINYQTDEIYYKLKCEPQKNNPYFFATKPKEIKFLILVKNGVRIDLSTGLFWNFGFTKSNSFDFIDYKYHFEAITDTSTIIIRENNDNLFFPTWGIIFNIYKRSPASIKIGASVGFGLSKQDVNYYLGPSFLFGRNERINLHLGLTGGQVDRIDGYNVGTIIYKSINNLPPKIPIKNSYKLGIYFGISFNILNSKILNNYQKSKSY